MAFDGAGEAGYRLGVTRPIVTFALVTAILAPATTFGGTVGVVVTGEPTAGASRAALRASALLEGLDEVDLVESDGLRRTLAGVPPPEAGDDPLADVRGLARAAVGEGRATALARLGGRLGLDLVVAITRLGGELEIRAFDVGRGAFYRGTLMVPVAGPLDRGELRRFVRARAATAAATAEAAREPASERRPASRWRRWWVWAIVGGAVVAVAAVAYFADTGGSEDRDVQLRLVAP